MKKSNASSSSFSNVLPRPKEEHPTVIQFLDSLFEPVLLLASAKKEVTRGLSLGGSLPGIEDGCKYPIDHRINAKTYLDQLIELIQLIEFKLKK